MIEESSWAAAYQAETGQPYGVGLKAWRTTTELVTWETAPIVTNDHISRRNKRGSNGGPRNSDDHAERQTV
jgi:hypothetical protein